MRQPEPAMHRRHSLRTRLLRHVMLPLALTWLLGMGLAMGVARYFTQKAFDRSLLDDAYSVASHVRKGTAEPLDFDLSAKEMNTLLFDQSESVFFAVLREDGSLLAGHPGLLPPQMPRDSTPVFASLDFQNRSLRSVVLQRQEPSPFVVVLAQTTTSQDKLFERLLFFSIAPQVLLLVWLALWLRRSIQRDLQPLVDLERAVERRDVQDLTPLRVSSNAVDLQRLGEAVNGLLDRIAQGVRAQREFSGNVAHELRTPLAGIRALADYGLSHAEPQVWREQLRQIVQSQERASRLVDQLLALALADEARQALHLEWVALDEVVRETLMRYLPRADALGVDLGGRGLDAPVRVWAQLALLEGVLGNLLDNALRHGRPLSGETSRVTVAITAGEASGLVVLSVQDNGPGISQERRARVLSRWERGRAGEALREGSGLGLALVAEYARILGARLRLEGGEDGQGLNVTLVFQPPGPSPDQASDSAG